MASAVSGAGRSRGDAARDIRPAGTLSAPTTSPSVAIFASSPALRAGLAALLSESPTVTVLTDEQLTDGQTPDVILLEAASESVLVDLIDEQWQQTALLLIGEPGASMLASPDRLVGAVSAAADGPRLSAAIHGLASGLIVLDPDLDASVHSVQRSVDESPATPSILTPRERQVLELVARGYPNKSIAYELGISEHTAKFHVGSLLTKLDAASRTEVVTNATRRGLLTV